jgi:hypothetical protein
MMTLAWGTGQGGPPTFTVNESRKSRAESRPDTARSPGGKDERMARFGGSRTLRTRIALCCAAAAMAVFTLAGAAPALATDDQSYDSDDFGFRLDIPAGWTIEHEESTDQSLHVILFPGSQRGATQLSIRVNGQGTTGNPLDAQAAALAAVRAAEQYFDEKTTTRRIAGRKAPGIQCDATSGAYTLRLRQAYLAENGVTYVLQGFAPVDGIAASVAQFDEIWDSFEFVPLDDTRRLRLGLSALARRCGSEVDWAADWKEAAARARAEDKLVLVAARIYSGFAISDELRAGPFMEPDIVAIVNERYIPFRMERETDVPFRDPDVYGLGPNTFGSAMLLVTPSGEVVLDGSAVTWDLLVQGLDVDRKHPGPPPARVEDRESQAAIHLRRGELAEVERLLTEPRTAGEHRLRAQVERLRRRGDAALEHLDAARSAEGADALAGDLDLDSALVLLRMNRNDEARELLEGVLSGPIAHARAPEAIYRLGTLDLVDGDKAAAESRWMELIAAHPDDRWSWKAAAELTGTAWELDFPIRLDWPEEVYYEALALPDYEAKPVARAGEARADALRYLLDHQRPDGSWLAPRTMGRGDDEPPDDFTLAITAICTQGLMRHRDDPEALAAVERGLEWLRPAYEHARTEGYPAHFMDYAVWSRAYVLWCLADALDAGLGPRDDVAPVAGHIAEELLQRQQSGGGWSYYVTGDLSQRDTPADQSISFTTAAVVLALQRAQAVGLDVPEALYIDAVECLERMRNDNGTFTYMLHHQAEDQGRLANEPGAAGRGPLCALALHRADRGSLAELRATLKLFARHGEALGAEQGKSLLHTGADAQGSHYLMFDYANAATAVAALPRGERRRLGRPILELILQARTAEGAYLDNTLAGRAYGAGMALIAFDALDIGG